MHDLKPPFNLIPSKLPAEADDVAIVDSEGVLFMEVWAACPKKVGKAAAMPIPTHIDSRGAAEKIIRILNTHWND